MIFQVDTISHLKDTWWVFERKCHESCSADIPSTQYFIRRKPGGYIKGYAKSPVVYDIPSKLHVSSEGYLEDISKEIPVIL